MKNKVSQIDIVVPLLNEEGSIRELIDRIFAILNQYSIESFRILFVDDGSTDGSWKLIEEFHQKYPLIIVAIKLRKNKGKAFALNAAFAKTEASIVFTMDADLQDDPKEIPRFLEELKNGADLVSGWKKKRNDPLSKTFPSKIFNWMVAKLTGIPLHDFNCGYKAYRGEVARNLNLYGELHRFTPVLASFYGYKISEIEVEHHARRHGHSKYGFERFVRGFIDLLTVLALTRFADRPAHLFGGSGLLAGIFGFTILAFLSLEKIFLGQNIGNRPLFQLGILLMILSIQLITFGIMAELTLRKNTIKPKDDLFIESSL